MNYSNLNFVLLQMTNKSLIVVEDLYRFLMEKSMAVSLFVDVHIHFSLCDFLTFKTLANSYLGFNDHKLFYQVDDIFQSGASLSLAEISELMIANQNSPSRAINRSSWHCKRMVIGGVSGRSNRGWEITPPQTPIFFLKKKIYIYILRNQNFSLFFFLIL
jgi:hypothetical protein